MVYVNILLKGEFELKMSKESKDKWNSERWVCSKTYFQGYLGGDYDDLGMFDTREDAERGIFPNDTLCDLLEDFKGKRVKISIELI